MFRSKRVTNALLLAALYAASFIGGVFLLFSIHINRDTSPLYFKGGLYVVFLILVTLSAFTSVLVAFVHRATPAPARLLPGGHFSAICIHSIFFLVTFCVGVYHIVTGILLSSAFSLAGICLIFAGVLALPGSLFSLFGAENGHAPLPAMLTGLSLVFSCALYALHLNFDTETPKNASMKLLLILVYLFLTLFYLSEIRRILGKKDVVLYRIASILAGHLAAASMLLPLGTLSTQVPLIGGIGAYLFCGVSFLYIIIWTILPAVLPAKVQEGNTNNTADGGETE